MDTKDLELKVQALLQRISELTQNYENAIADLRVALTNSEEAVRFLQQNQRADPTEEANEHTVPVAEIPGEVVDG